MSSDVQANEAHGEGEAHGSVAMYIWIGVILAVLTFVEVAVFYIEALDHIEVPILVVLSTAKVILVIMYFMHLKMEHRALTWIFMTGVVLFVFLVTALVILYQVLPGIQLF
ncbi:MAG: cytochrome C oxidase subunit IV [Gemmatimonadales bacterium]|nr:MAG: cytochrome C oxidase subunit IV [Gemmatimonadales bacterium]